MDSSYSSEVGRNDNDFGFAFNDSNFSDRVLCIEIVSKPLEVTPGGESFISLADWARNHKRRREDTKTEKSANHIDSSSNIDYLSGVRVKTVHINSVILAAKSPVFYKLFSNGMKESAQRHVKLRINASEEAAFMELLNFIYSKTLIATTIPTLLDVLMAADKFEVTSCMRHCGSLLKNLPMTCDSALIYLDLPSSLLMAEAVQPLTNAVKEFLLARYKDITKYKDEVLNLSLAGMEVILSSDDLHVASIHYPKIEDRRKILTTHLAEFIRFPYMKCKKLKEVLTCNEFDPNFAQKAVLKALFYKLESPHENPNRPRAYNYRLVKVIQFEQPRQQCIVYLDLKREECASLVPLGSIYSQVFHLGGQGFYLLAQCNIDGESQLPCFGLFLGTCGKGPVPFTVDFEFGARSNPDEEYISKYKSTYIHKVGTAVGYENLFEIPFSAFIREESVYFINGVLHLRGMFLFCLYLVI